MTKTERFELFVERLQAAPTAANGAAAFNLVCEILNRVEDEHSGSSFDPENWRTSDRLYPPQADSIKQVRADLVRYRSKGHFTFIASNGAICIVPHHASKPVVSKAGSDGFFVYLAGNA